MGLSQIPGNLAPARLFLGQTFTAIPDSMLLQLQSCFCLQNYSSASTTFFTSLRVVRPLITSNNPDW